MPPPFAVGPQRSGWVCGLGQPPPSSSAPTTNREFAALGELKLLIANGLVKESCGLAKAGVVVQLYGQGIGALQPVLAGRIGKNNGLRALDIHLQQREAIAPRLPQDVSNRDRCDVAGLAGGALSHLPGPLPTIAVEIALNRELGWLRPNAAVVERGPGTVGGQVFAQGGEIGGVRLDGHHLTVGEMGEKEDARIADIGAGIDYKINCLRSKQAGVFLLNKNLSEYLNVAGIAADQHGCGRAFGAHMDVGVSLPERKAQGGDPVGRCRELAILDVFAFQLREQQNAGPSSWVTLPEVPCGLPLVWR